MTIADSRSRAHAAIFIFSIFDAFQYASVHSLIYQADRIVDAKDARIAPTAAGLLYGWGVFATLRIYDGKRFAFDRHWKRLVNHAESARVPAALDLKEARRGIDKVIAANPVEPG